MKILKQKIILAIILLFAFSFNLFANESITFTWEDGWFWIKATPGKQYTINWGDGSTIETIVQEKLWCSNNCFFQFSQGANKASTKI